MKKCLWGLSIFKNKLGWVPNFLSILRIILAPVVVALLCCGNVWLATCVFTLAMMTDFWDGYYARRLNALSYWGIFLDPVADKLLTHSILLYFWWTGCLWILPVLLVILRDFAISLLRLFLGVCKCPVPASLFGKFKTSLQFTLIYIVLGAMLLGVENSAFFFVATNVVLWLIVCLAMVSAWRYVKECVLHPRRISTLKFVCWVLATGFGFGLSPIWPGFVGSLVTVTAWFYLPSFGMSLDMLIMAVIAVVGFYTADYVARSVGSQDPSYVVIDEFLGMWIVLCGMPKTVAFALAAFILFRIFDVFKPYPISRIERLPWGWGIMLDDVAAGLVARLVLLICCHV